MLPLRKAAPQNEAKSKAEIEATVHHLAPFHHAIDLPYGLSTYVPELSRQNRERTRLPTFLDHAWGDIVAACGGSLKRKRVLDIACNCGGFSVQAARSGAEYVCGIDIDPHYIEQANFVKDTIGLPNLEFQQIDLLELHPSTHGVFDLVLCLGILYHLENPVFTMKRISAITGEVLVVDTTLMKVPLINPILERWPLWHMRRVSAATPDASNISTARWRPKDFCQFSPNAPAVKSLLEYCGFGDIVRLKPTAKGLEDRYYSGQRATFIARKSQV
ncbi:methyltransferase domain-containing protein [Rhizobium sp. KVB221]|uniref:Methyltransferase domain-containing protein n=1 Tax=Rhizobium setariae TaxID=2801340 RepID=A0A936YRD8_9HYPH|nr:methyltransferase domain-containing protein [Rhizobium setariae]MBL0375355.1 methyltransferase domain-containing protein [Rhizobium setariae]